MKRTENTSSRRLTAPAVFPSKLYERFSIEADPVVAKLHARRSEPLFIICPGPTSLEINPYDVIGRGVIFRMNTFFIEQEPRFGKHIDAYFWSNGVDVLYDELERAIEIDGYQIEAFFSPLLLRRQDKDDAKAQKQEKLFQPASDHWAVIGLNPVLAREMIGRPLPTQAFQVLAAATIMGFEEIHLIGVDMYSDKDRRYAYDYPDRMKQRVDKKHYTPAYERGAHNHERDLIFLETILTQFPNTRIYNASRVSPLTQFLPLSPLAEGKSAGAPTHIAPLPQPNPQARKSFLRTQWDRLRRWSYPFKVKLYRALGREL